MYRYRWHCFCCLLSEWGGVSCTLAGPDERRLLAPGDFNVELAFTELQVGANSVVITATDVLGTNFRDGDIAALCGRACLAAHL